ncbi:MAG: hypothetical protein JJU10_05545 [Idiomarina sp.]|nr:hypothetical protein [Idiomarina sp.]
MKKSTTNRWNTNVVTSIINTLFGKQSRLSSLSEDELFAASKVLDVDKSSGSVSVKMSDDAVLDSIYRHVEKAHLRDLKMAGRVVG